LSGFDPGATGTDPDGLFEQLLEVAPDAIVGTGADQRIVLVNAQTERLFGYTRSELLGETLELLVPEHRPTEAGLELSGRRKDGGEFPAEISLSAMKTEDGQVTLAVIRDIGERRAAE
jgi:PAS domain S-box-containing protein